MNGTAPHRDVLCTADTAHAASHGHQDVCIAFGPGQLPVDGGLRSHARAFRPLDGSCEACRIPEQLCIMLQWPRVWSCSP